MYSMAGNLYKIRLFFFHLREHQHSIKFVKVGIKLNNNYQKSVNAGQFALSSNEYEENSVR